MEAVGYPVRSQAAASGLADVSEHDMRHMGAPQAIDAGVPLHRRRNRLWRSNVR